MKVRQRAVRLAQEHRGMWAAVVSMRGKTGCTRETLRRLVASPRTKNQGVRDRMTSVGRGRLKALERENRELKRANEICAARGGTLPCVRRPAKCGGNCATKGRLSPAARSSVWMGALGFAMRSGQSRRITVSDDPADLPACNVNSRQRHPIVLYVAKLYPR